MKGCFYGLVSVVEIGCSLGFFLESICDNCECSAVKRGEVLQP